ncbi:MAG: hypothetical protein KJ000_09340 [Pirellulaceae bacterium]|nr:hypothetical protein [Pirellulaceae bacterium]
MNFNRETAEDVRSQCGGCTGGPCPLAPPDHEPVLQGWRLSWASLLFFALPMAGAIIGAACGRNEASLQLVGGLTGLVTGMVASGMVARLFDDRKATA